MSIKDMVDARVRREREAEGERLVWLKPGSVVVGREELEELKAIANRVHYGELVVAPTLAQHVLALGQTPAEAAEDDGEAADGDA